MNRFSWGICAVLTIASSLSTAFARSEDDPFFDGGNVDQLAELGWDLTKPLDMDFLLSFEHASDAEAFSRKLTSLGYTTEIRPCAKDPCTLIVATKLMVPNRAQIVEHGKKLDEMVVDYYGRYLGWVTDMFLRVDEELQKNVRAATHQGNVLVAATIVPRMWVETIISVCARRAPLTTPEGELAAAAWQQRNKLNLDTLDELLARFPSYLEKTTGFGGGELFVADVRKDIRGRAEHEIAQLVPKMFDSNSGLDDEAACRNVVAAIDAGAYDIERNQPEAYKLIQQHQQEKE